MQFSGSKSTILTYGCFEYGSKLSMGERLVLIEKDITELMKYHKPDAMAIETLIFNKNITTAMQVAEARGVMLLCAAKQHIPVQPCTPLQVKMAITGYGRADKKQMLHMIKLQLGLKETHKLDDAIDALGIAITGYGLATTYKAQQKTS